MRVHTSILLSVLILTQVFASANNTQTASQTSSQVLLVESFITQGGSRVGSLPALHMLDQSINDDTPDNYLSLTTPGKIYVGYDVFHLPPEIRIDRITSLLFQVNFKGPSNDVQVWMWSIYDWDAKMWQKIGDTVGSNAGEWTTFTFKVKPLSRYSSPSREMRVQVRSNNASEDIQLDYEAFHITYMPFVPTPTRSVGTSVPTKGVFVLPTTLTPSPTSTPTNTPTATITPSPTNTLPATNTPNCVTLNGTFESQVLTLLNQERTSRGIPALTSNNKLHNASLGHTQDMACNDFVSHTGSDGSDPGDRITAAGYDFSTWGENVAAGYTSPSSVVNAWMNSSGHRANILNPAFTEIGIGYIYNSASYYGHYWTTDFGAP
jgi:uncharacterized protein YkwD